MAYVHVIETYQPYCFDCCWEGASTSWASDARAQAAAHSCGNEVS